MSNSILNSQHLEESRTSHSTLQSERQGPSWQSNPGHDVSQNVAALLAHVAGPLLQVWISAGRDLKVLPTGLQVLPTAIGAKKATG
jgi:hypothetical protein